MSTIRIATRGSPLALAQSGAVGRLLQAQLDRPFELIEVRTTGDRIQDRPLAQIGGKGLFVKEIEEALLEGRADLAVHSAKDLPARFAPGLALAAFPEREDPRDALVGEPVAGLRPGARVGTGSARRASQLLRHRPDLEVVPLRGNVETRLRKREEESLDAVVLACAGLARLGLEDRITERVDPDVLLPAVAQGTLALQTREDDALRQALEVVDHAATRCAAEAERAFLTRLEGDCSVPLAAYCEPTSDGRVRLRGRVLSPDGRDCAAAETTCPAAQAEAEGASLADRVLSDGGREILEALAR